jgi:Rps23 Pro-64 3,4-dihydroxylase Tpa1-like proline 4-hydroxylase
MPKKTKKQTYTSSQTGADDLFNKYINKTYQSNVSNLTQQYQSGKPFAHIHLNNFFSDEQFLNHLFTEMEQEKYVEKSNDLYSFLQTKRDLRSVLQQDEIEDKKSGDELSHISKLCKIIYSKGFRNMIQTITGIDVELNDRIDMSGACYRDGAHLLCHDDELEGRRIAYILYFVDKEWKKEDGGRLELFNVDQNGQPDKIETSLVPEWNSFAFFEVTPYSFHQVSEVLQDDRFRVSISGWFHGPPIKRPPPYIEQPLSYSNLQDNKNLKLNEWLNDLYLLPKTHKQIREAFEEECSVNLQKIFKQDKFDQLKQALEQHKHWNMIGPANRRHYEKMEQVETPAIVQELFDLLKSQQFAQCLKTLLNVDITRVNVQGRRFTPGCYTLVHNQPTDETRLDAVYCLTGDDWDFDYGGQIVYMDEEEELLSVPPQENSLSLVLRDIGTMQFIKYLNHNAPTNRTDISVTYDVDVSSSDDGTNDEDEDEEHTEDTDDGQEDNEDGQEENDE